MRNKERSQRVNILCTLLLVFMLVGIMGMNPNKEDYINGIIENSEFAEDETQVIPEGTSEFVTIDFLREELDKGVDRRNYILFSTYKVNENLSKTIPGLYEILNGQRVIGVLNKFINY